VHFNSLKVLILKPSSLGDVVQALPVLRSIKRHLPHSEIHWWIDSNLAPLLEGDPDLAGIVRFERRRWARPANLLALIRNLHSLRQVEFDWVIDLQCLARSGAFAWMVNGRLLIGLDEPREGARGLYDIIVPRRSFLTHAVDWYLDVLPALGVPPARDYQWLPPRPQVAATLRQKWPLGAGPWLLLQPGARWLNKRWPVEHFSELVRRLAGWRSDLRFAVLGGAEDTLLGRTIARVDAQRCLDLTGRLSLPEMVEWIRAGTLLVTNDTGPMHVAVAVQTPVVALFGPTEPRRTGPYGQLDSALQTNLDCVPCLRSRCARAGTPCECLQALTPGLAAAAVQKLLETLPVHALSRSVNVAAEPGGVRS